MTSAERDGSAVIVEEEVLPLGEAPQEPPEQPPEEAPPPPKLERQKAVDWKEKVACEGCGRVLSKHTLEFTHQCKGPKPAKAPRARIEPREPKSAEPPREPRSAAVEPPPPQPTRDQLIRAMMREEKQRREAAQCAPLRRFYGLA